MPAPVEQVHVDLGRIGKLDDEDAVAGNGADGLDVDPACERVEGIEDQADVRMIGTAYDLPGVAVVVDVATPGERFIADADAAPCRPFAKFTKIVGCAVDAAQRDR